MAADFFLSTIINQQLLDRLVAAGITPTVTDVRRSDAFARLFNQVLGAIGVVALDIVASPAAIASVAAETVFAAPGQLVFPANSLNAIGTRVDFKAGGTFATTGTPTTLFGARLGGLAGTVVGNGSALTASNNSTAAGWHFEGGFVVRTTGATGTLLPDNARSGIVNAASGAGAMLPSLGNTGVAASAATDLTAALTFVITQTWSASSASNTITMTYLKILVSRLLS
jgi:hypothetical protein